MTKKYVIQYTDPSGVQGTVKGPNGIRYFDNEQQAFIAIKELNQTPSAYKYKIMETNN